MRRTRFSFIAMLACAAAFALIVSPARASTTTDVYCSAGGALQPAIDRAASGDTLIVHGICSGSFRVLSKDLTLQGAAAGTLAGPAGGSMPTLSVAAPGRFVTVSRLSITGGSGTSGGGIALSDGQLTVSGSTIAANRATDGAGIFAGNGQLDVLNTKIQGNVASGVGGGIAVGAASVNVTASTVSGNTAAGLGGGGISVAGGLLAVTGSTISGNKSTASSGGVNVLANGFGGGGVRAISGSISLVGTTVSGNQSSAFGGGILHGGSAASSDALTITGSTVTGNESKYDGGGILNAAVATLDGNSTVVLRGSKIWSNTTSLGSGAGIANYADGYLASVDSAGSALGKNRAGGGDGGGISNIAQGSGGLAVVSMIGGIGGAAATFSVAANQARRGGGIYSSGVGASILLGSGTAVIGNTALVAGGGIFNTDGGSVVMSSLAIVLMNNPNDCFGC